MRILDKRFKVYSGYNFRVLEMPGYDALIFGCPPGIVKDFARRKRDLPSHFVLPTRTLIKGKNNFDFEFIVYHFLFMRGKKEKITIYCTPEQRLRFITILSETLFGPTFHHLLEGQFNKFMSRAGMSAKEKVRFRGWLEKVANDKKIFEKFQQMLHDKASDRAVSATLREYFEKALDRQKWILGKSKTHPAREFSKNYLLCAQLQTEMELFSMTRNCTRLEFIENTVDFVMFDKHQSICLTHKEDPRKKIEIIQLQPSYFEVYENSGLKVQLDFQNVDPPPIPEKIELLDKPEFGATFLGVGSGFAHNRNNSCLVAWTEGRGIMVDAFSDHGEFVLANGITENDIDLMFLSHVHSDHDSGFIEKILSGQRIRVITTRIIYESFLRKIEAITLFPMDVLEQFVDFHELIPNKKMKLPGFERSYIEFDYSLHSIPAGRFRLTYVDARGKEKVISHSGDTKYDLGLLEQWYREGAFTKKRLAGLMGFVWDADLIVHEVGGGQLHTEFSALAGIDSTIAKKMVLVHQHQDPIPHPYFRFGYEGETRTLVKSRKVKKLASVSTLKGISLFHDIPDKELRKMLKHSKIRNLKARQTLFSKGDRGDSFYVILAGFAEIVLNKKLAAIYEKGMFFGELAISTDNPKRRATVKALSPLTLLEIPKKFYFECGLPAIMDEFYGLDNHFNQAVRPELVASLGFGSLTHWKKGQAISSTRNSADDSIFLIISGKVKISSGKGKKIAFLSSGDIMGEISDWKKITRSSEVNAHSDEVFAVELRPEQVSRLFKLYPSFHGTVYQKIKKLEARLTS